MVFRLPPIVLSGFIVLSMASCKAKNDFVITDDYVKKEQGIKSEDDRSSTLSSADKKYLADKLGVSSEQVSNDKLYFYIKQYESKKFVSGGSTLVTQIYNEVYNKKLSGTPTQMISDKRIELFKSEESLKEGDLIFFRNNPEQVVTHVGVYLQNSRFISSMYGEAEIFNLNKGAWKSTMISMGRLK